MTPPQHQVAHDAVHQPAVEQQLHLVLAFLSPVGNRPGPGEAAAPPPSGILYTWYMVVQGGMYWYKPVRTLADTWQYKKRHIGTSQYVLT